jgi:hypothetical protein
VEEKVSAIGKKVNGWSIASAFGNREFYVSVRVRHGVQAGGWRPNGEGEELGQVSDAAA